MRSVSGRMEGVGKVVRQVHRAVPAGMNAIIKAARHGGVNYDVQVLEQPVQMQLHGMVCFETRCWKNCAKEKRTSMGFRRRWIWGIVNRDNHFDCAVRKVIEDVSRVGGRLRCSCRDLDEPYACVYDGGWKGGRLTWFGVVLGLAYIGRNWFSIIR